MFFPSLFGFPSHQRPSLKNTGCHSSSEYSCTKKSASSYNCMLQINILLISGTFQFRNSPDQVLVNKTIKLICQLILSCTYCSAGSTSLRPIYTISDRERQGFIQENPGSCGTYRGREERWVFLITSEKQYVL